MDVFLVILIAVICLAVGVLTGAAAAAAREGRARSELRGRLSAAEATRDTMQAQLDAQQRLYRDVLDQTRADQAAREERERREQAVLRALAPVRESLESMQRKVDDLERERVEQFGLLSEQLRRAQQSDEALRATTESLASAMRSGSTRGVWGETQLRRVVEAAGLTRHVDFDLQSSVTTDAGAGRPDMVVRLPQGKALAVDAKVPLEAYLSASAIPFTAEGDDRVRRRSLLERHAKAVRAHVDALAKKGYWTGLETSPEFVVCFIPSESILAAALDEDPTLLDYAFTRRVALASPVNLWAVLKTVAYVWTQQDVSREARELLALGTEMYERVGTVAKHADDLRRALERTVDSYNRFAGSLESRLLVTARKFPGIDDTKRDALTSPSTLDTAPRRWTAEELLASAEDAAASGTEPAENPTDVPMIELEADLEEVRARLRDDAR